MKQSFAIPGILSLIAIYWLYASVTEYGIWDEGPLGGFMPMLASVIVLGFSLAAILKSSGKRKPLFLSVFIPVVVVIAVILTVPVLGLLPGLFIMLLCWFKFLERYSWLFSLTMAVCVTGCVWLIFSLWLNVPFPKGMLGI